MIPNLESKYLKKLKEGLQPAGKKLERDRNTIDSEEYEESGYSWGLLEFILLFEVFDWFDDEISTGFDQFGSEFESVQETDSGWGGDFGGDGGDSGCSGCGGCGGCGG